MSDAAARRREWPLALLTAAIAAFVFLPCAGYGLVNYDDRALLAPVLRGLGAPGWTHLLTGAYFCHYAPLSWLTYAALSGASGGDPRAYHAAAVAAHAACAALAYLAALEIFGRGRPQERDRAAALIAALLFALHPLRAQSVAWASELRGTLSGLFCLASVLLWLRADRAAPPRDARTRAVSLAAFLLALAAKSTALPLPAGLAALELLRPAPWSRPRARALARRLAPFILLAAVFAVLALRAESACGAISGLARTGVGERLLRALAASTFYLGKTLWPAGLSLYEWHWPVLRASVLLGAAATAVLLAAAARSRALRPAIFAALAWQLVFLAPVLGFVTLGHEPVADRYSYVSCLGWAALAGAGFRAFMRRRRTAAILSAGALIALLAGLSRAQCAYWSDSTTLWTRVLALDPASWVARPNLADALISQRRYAQALSVLDDQLRVYPQDEEVRAARAALAAHIGAR